MTSSGLSPDCQFGSAASSTRRKEAGIDTRPFASTLWWLSPLNLRLNVPCPFLSAPPRENVYPQKVETAG